MFEIVPEVRWKLASVPDLLRIPDSLKKRTGMIGWSLSFSGFDRKLNVWYENPSFTPLLQEKFILAPLTSNNDPSLIFINPDKQSAECFSYNRGYLDGRSPWRSLVFSEEFGILKSVISGLASYIHEPQEYYPVHAAVFSIDGKGVALVGGSMAGKTTSLIRIARLALEAGRTVQVLTDDWAVLRETIDGSVEALTFDPSVSIRRHDLHFQPGIRFLNHAQIIRSLGSRHKLSLNPDVLYGAGTSSERIKITTLVCLLPYPGPKVLEMCSIDFAASWILNTAYHYPYVSSEQIERHRCFWYRVLPRLEPCYFATRSSGEGFQDVAPILEGILK